MAEPQGRGRGRGVRARSKLPAQAVPEPPRAPGGPPRSAGPHAAMPPPKPAPTSSGRATHRGAGRPADESAGITKLMSQASIGGTGSGNGSSGDGQPMAGRGNLRGKRLISYVRNVKTRPEELGSKKGASGKPVKLLANYFPVLSKHDWGLYQYRVDFAPDIELTAERKRLFRGAKEKIKHAFIFDGTVMYSAYKLPENPMEVYVARESDDSQIKISIRLVVEVLEGDNHYLQFFNIMTKKCLGMLNLKLINRDYFDPAAKVNVPEYSLELWPGYKTVIRQHDNQVLMCAEITHKVMRTDTCYQLMTDIARRNPRDYKNEFTRAVIGQIVLTGYNNNTYLISDVNYNESPSSTFDRNGVQTSYVTYYKERYNIKILDISQPLLVTKSKPRMRRAVEQKAVELAGPQDQTLIIFLIPELCRMTGVTDEMRTDFSLMRSMATHTRIGPAERIDRLMAMNHRLNSEERVCQEFKQWDMQLSNKLVEIPARIVQSEHIVLGNGVSVPSGAECDWTRDLRSNPMLAMPEGGLSRWAVVCPQKLYRDSEVFVDTLYRAARGMKFHIAQPEYYEISDPRLQTYVMKLDEVISQYNPQLILVAVMNNKADLYSAIKKKSLVDRAVPTQVILAKNLNNKKGGMSIATKVAIQINCKIGGAPWTVAMPITGLMVVGFDVCHDSKAKGKSYGAMVASLNKPMSRYFSAVSHHSTGEELSNDLAMNIVKAIQCYKRHNNALPSHIIIYRDGVGDGQIPYVFTHEVERIVSAVREMYGQAPKIAFVIVCKRINTRLFCNRANPPPGTVVDDVITLPERYDFFIVSQYVNQGTVSPTSYNIIHDTFGLDPDKMQRLTFKLTHCYYNWSGTVRVPAPVQYAHKLAFMVSQSLHRQPNQSLEELLYFL